MKSLLLLMAFFPPLLWLQQSVVRDSDPPAKWKVDFDTSSGTEVRLPSLAMRHLPKCRGGMCYAVFAMDPPIHPDASGKLPPAGPPLFPMEMAAFSLSGQSHFLDPSLIQGLTYVTILDFAPNEDGSVYVLIHAIEKDSLPKRTSAPDSNTTAPSTFNQVATNNNCLAVYDSNGQFIGIHHLELQFEPVRMVSLTDQILVSGFDRVHNQAVLAILGTDGSLVRLLDDQGTLPNAATLLASAPWKVDKNASLMIQQVAMSTALSRLTFGYVGGRALLLDPGANAAIWEIKGTEVERTNLKMPRGVVAASIVPSDGAWLIRAFVSATDSGMLLEFDRETGELKRQVDSGGVPATSIFFESGNTFYALWWNARYQSFIVKSR
jgi:hypothetical protein